MAVLRMVQAGAIPLTTAQYLKEMQRDWARQETAQDLTIYEQHSGTYGAGLKYQQTLVAGKWSRKHADLERIDDAFAGALVVCRCSARGGFHSPGAI
jgi:hypothetical protein